MSVLSKITGIGISRKGIKINPGRALSTALTLGSFGALGPVAGMLGKVPGIAKIGGALKLGGLFGKGAGAVNSMGAEPGRFRSIGQFFGGKDGLGMDDVMKYGEAAGDAYDAYQGNQRRNRAVRMAEQELAAGAPMRDAARRTLMDDSRPDLSGVFTEPQAPPRYRRVNVGSR